MLMRMMIRRFLIKTLALPIVVVLFVIGCVASLVMLISYASIMFIFEITKLAKASVENEVKK